MWMRTAATSTVRKVYGRLDADVLAGTTLVFSVVPLFPVAGFGGTKAIVVSTANPLGFKSAALGAAYVAVGSLAFASAIGFAVKMGCSNVSHSSDEDEGSG